MSLPNLNPQRSLFDTDLFHKRLFEQALADRFRFFAEPIRPQLIRPRPSLEAMYCPHNGRPAEVPVRMLGVLILQYMERLPDRQAAEACTYDLRWKMALGMEADEPAFHPTSLVYFRRRLLEHGREATALDAVLEAMRRAGYLKARKAQRLNSTHVLGLVSEMSRLECVRESLRRVLEHLEWESALARPAARPVWWERCVESQPDYKAGREALQAKLIMAGQDARDVLRWVAELPEDLQGRASSRRCGGCLRRTSRRATADRRRGGRNRRGRCTIRTIPKRNGRAKARSPPARSRGWVTRCKWPRRCLRRRIRRGRRRMR